MASTDCNERRSRGHGTFCVVVDTRESGSRGSSRRDVNVTASGWTTSMGRMGPGLQGPNSGGIRLQGRVLFELLCWYIHCVLFAPSVYAQTQNSTNLAGPEKATSNRERGGKHAELTHTRKHDLYLDQEHNQRQKAIIESICPCMLADKDVDQQPCTF